MRIPYKAVAVLEEWLFRIIGICREEEQLCLILESEDLPVYNVHEAPRILGCTDGFEYDICD